jgi:hypothetical protein
MGITTPAPTNFQQPFSNFTAAAIFQLHNSSSQSPIPRCSSKTHSNTREQSSMTQSSREMPQSIPVPERPVMEAANPRSFTAPSTSSVGSLIQRFEHMRKPEGSFEQLVAKSATVTAENLLGLAKDLGVVVPPGLLRSGMPRIAKYIDEAVKRGKARM